MLSQHDEIILAARMHIKDTMPEDFTGHDYLHVERVWETSKRIAASVGANSMIAELAALFHDISDYKLNGGDEYKGPELAKNWIIKSGISNDIAEAVSHIILNIPFKGVNSKNSGNLSLEAQCVQDADRLDAMGSIGIARAFAFGGAFKQAIVNPEIPPAIHNSFEEYKKKDGTTVNHFFEKLFHLKDRMNTEMGKKIASERHLFMIDFIRRLSDEINIDMPKIP